MNVSFQSSQAGLRSSIELQETAAARVSNGTLYCSNNSADAAVAKNSTDDISTAVGEMIISKNAYSANAKVIKVQNRLLGELLDIIG